MPFSLLYNVVKLFKMKSGESLCRIVSWDFSLLKSLNVKEKKNENLNKGKDIKLQGEAEGDKEKKKIEWLS